MSESKSEPESDNSEPESEDFKSESDESESEFGHLYFLEQICRWFLKAMQV